MKIIQISTTIVLFSIISFIPNVEAGWLSPIIKLFAKHFDDAPVPAPRHILDNIHPKPKELPWYWGQTLICD